jgi:mechanosensitive ion channel-like protein
MLAQVDLEGGLEEAWRDVATFVPKLLGFLIILLIGWFVAKALSKLTNALLERIGFDRWVERGALRESFARSKTDPSDILAVVVFWAVFLIALQLAFGIWGPNPVSDLLEGLIAYLPNVFVAVVILVIAAAVAKAVTDVVSAMLAGATAGAWIARAAGIAILVLGVFAALNQLQVAPEIVNGLFYALLAVIVGSAIVAIGGGGIRTMSRYWDRWSTRLEATTVDLRENADPEAARSQLERRIEEERSRASASGDTGVTP